MYLDAVQNYHYLDGPLSATVYHRQCYKLELKHKSLVDNYGTHLLISIKKLVWNASAQTYIPQRLSSHCAHVERTSSGACKLV